MHYRQQLQGGATSSKKISMEKAVSKSSPHQKKPSQVTNRGQREETEVDDENEEEGSSYLQEFQRAPKIAEIMD